MDHEWRPVVGYEGIYEVRPGNDGGSVRRVTPIKRSRVGKELGGFDCFGYKRANLSKPGHPCKLYRLHELILLAFVGPKPSPKHIGKHLDDVKMNNTVGNLTWGTKKQNNQDAWNNGVRKPNHGRWLNTPPAIPSWVPRRKM